MIKDGVYEQVIYEDLKNKLKELDADKYILEKETIDVEEANQWEAIEVKKVRQKINLSISLI